MCCNQTGIIWLIATDNLASEYRGTGRGQFVFGELTDGLLQVFFMNVHKSTLLMLLWKRTLHTSVILATNICLAVLGKAIVLRFNDWDNIGLISNVIS